MALKILRGKREEVLDLHDRRGGEDSTLVEQIDFILSEQFLRQEEIFKKMRARARKGKGLWSGEGK